MTAEKLGLEAVNTGSELMRYLYRTVVYSQLV